MAGGTIIVPSGILHKPTAVLAKGNDEEVKPCSKRGNHARLKLLLRRLPPGLTEPELVSELGPDWKVGSGKLTHLIYRPGKVSKDLTTPSRESRAYLIVSEEAQLPSLAEKVRQSQFQDARNTVKDSFLLGPPVLEYAPYSRTFVARRRKDARQGTIDQDSDFIAFLEALTMPTQKPVVELDPSKDEKITTTPLIEHIREKKAQKEKTAFKPSKRGEARDIAKRKDKFLAPPALSPEKTRRTARKLARPLREAAKASNNGVATTQATQAAQAVPATQVTPTPARPTVANSTRRRERPGAFNLAAKIQSDLGLGPSIRPSSGPRLASATPSQACVGAKSTQPASPSREGLGSRDRKHLSMARSGPLKSDDAVKPSITMPPRILKKPSANQPTASNFKTLGFSSNTPPPPSAHMAQSVLPSRHRAFLKHAYPSQGMTEALIRSALSIFGTVNHVNIDKRRGTAYADFADAAGLAAAISAGRLDVAQGVVQVLEHKERGPRVESASRSTGAGASASSGAHRSTASNLGPSNSRSGPSEAAGKPRGGFRGRARGRGNSTRSVSSSAVPPE